MSKAKLSYSELLDAFEFVSASAPMDNRAFIDRGNGKIHYLASELDFEEKIPDDLESSNRYVEVPHKYDLDLGRNFILSFIQQELPDEYETVSEFFRRKGAYRRFKDFLDSRNQLERWYEYQSRETEKALRLWCDENGLELIDDSSTP
ncbi:UPF0158 family protein [Methylocaldum szegediense]|uniref:Uncharacterized protein n=1 Tax=Methylocaldum szegediense TaxID=73780 RepID=A0ABM9I6I6_9GAMM|nr:UPF0158 family protein [Methylocaldum szegediense]CAI8925130.1 conserved protein of unknown function [Methylocaldum szegediense]